ncbi:MAG: sigma-54-dependent Fis family transcriptional regulator [Betaproteobacteria bacterium]|nr:sigma-54-dependent Fis family transcriptional regulator [Betaproteobacteria bacterium]
MPRILIVEDDEALAELLRMQLEDDGHLADHARTLALAGAMIEQHSYDAVLLDQQLPDGPGLGFLNIIKQTNPELPAIMITGVNDTALPIEAIKAGAYDFVRKPMDRLELSTTLTNALNACRLARRAAAVEIAEDVDINRIVGQSRVMLDICKTVGRVAPTGATVLITGESGTGKEMVARAIHHYSGRTGPFIAVNCSAIVDTLLESELFGHEKGAFTGADRGKPGKFELAADGTLFLDEIGEMSPPLQAKLLRVLQERVYERVGGTDSLVANARIVAATNRDIGAEVQNKRFREDLYYRLNVISIHLPPLRERREDLRPMVDHFLAKLAFSLHKRVTRVSPDAWQQLEGYPWPGNVRELENVLTRAVVLARGDILGADLLGLSTAPSAGPPATAVPTELISLEELELRHVRAVMEHTGGHKGQACAILGISRPALERKLHKLAEHRT